jgi:ATP:ADP antiporter, AAA family
LNDAAPTRGPTRGWLERALGAITRVEPGEAGTALLLTLDVFALLTSYYLVKPVREGLILSLPGGAELKAYASGAIAALLVLLVPIYGKVAARWPRNRLIAFVTTFFAVCLLVFWGLGRTAWVDSGWLGIAFYLWVGVFNLVVVAQFWAFANDVYTVEQGKRLFALVGLGASIGAASGSRFAAWALGFVGLTELLLLGALLLVFSAILGEVIHRRENGRHPPPRATPPEPGVSVGTNGLSMIAADPFLMRLAIFTLVFTFANTNGEYVLGVLIKQAALDAEAQGILGSLGPEAYIGRLYGRFYFWVNVLGIGMQALLVSRLVKWGGVGLALLFLPMIALGTWASIVVAPILVVVWVAKTLENAGDYSVHNTARQMLWLPLPAHVKYNAKQATDTVFVRGGDVASALLVFFAVEQLAIGVRTVAVINLGLVAVWLWLAVRLVSAHRRMVAARTCSGGPRPALAAAGHATHVGGAGP